MFFVIRIYLFVDLAQWPLRHQQTTLSSSTTANWTASSSSTSSLSSSLLSSLSSTSSACICALVYFHYVNSFVNIFLNFYSPHCSCCCCCCCCFHCCLYTDFPAYPPPRRRCPALAVGQGFVFGQYRRASSSRRNCERGQGKRVGCSISLVFVVIHATPSARAQWATNRQLK